MLDQSISKKSISYVVTDNERYIYSSEFKNKTEEVLIDECISLFQSSSDFPDIDFVEVNNKKIFKIDNFTTHVLHKRLNTTLKVINKSKQSDRESIVRSIKDLLRGIGGGSILRLDISGFYESVSLSYLREIILGDDIYSNSTKDLLKKWLVCFESSGADGLPRGLSLSSTLSEMYMKKFDSKVKLSNSILYYARFVDDIFIFSLQDKVATFDELLSFLPEGIEFNDADNKKYLTDVMGSETDRGVDFGYLGYRFVTIKDGKSIRVEVGLSKDKIKKFKGRLSKALLAYSNDNKFDLLEKRFRFLTCNYILSSRYRGTKVRSGIYYNYKSITDYGLKDLEYLDEFKNSLIFNDNFRTNLNGSPIVLSKIQKIRLAKKSFLYGYKNKIFHKFTVSKIDEIKGCWK